MKRSRFDRLTRSLAAVPALPDLGTAFSRRGVVRLLGGVGLGGALVVGTDDGTLTVAAGDVVHVRSA